jgi:hypothetical protein
MSPVPLIGLRKRPVELNVLLCPSVHAGYPLHENHFHFRQVRSYILVTLFNLGRLAGRAPFPVLAVDIAGYEPAIGRIAALYLVRCPEAAL